MDSVANSSSPRDKAIAYLTWIAFFFLLQTGEYCAGGIDVVSTPFNLRDIQPFVGSLLFTTQKNGVKGALIRHGATGHPRACAVAAILRRVAHLRQHGATPDTHLTAVFNGVKWSTVHSAEITAALCAPTTIVGPQVGFTPEDVSAHSMRASGSMALLMARVVTYTIRLVGRWRSNIMLRYLHTMAQTFTEGLAARMVQHWDYALIPPAHGD